MTELGATRMAIGIRGACVTAALVLVVGCSPHRPAPARFAMPVTYEAGPNPWRLAVGDLDGDGLKDVVVGSNPPTPGQLTVMLNRGGGMFGVTTSSPLDDAAALALGELTGDGVTDIVVAEKGPGAGATHLFLGLGKGAFADDQTYDAAPAPNGIAIADFDGDGKPDLAVSGVAVANNMGVGHVGVLISHGGGLFANAVDTVAGNGPASIAAGDVDGDGKPDLAIGAYGGKVTILVNDGGGRFHTSGTYAAGPNGETYTDAYATLSDLDRDGKLDLVAVNFGGQDAVALLNDGHGAFKPASDSPLAERPVALAAGDLNGDGIPDLAIVDEGGLTILLGYGDGTFAANDSADMGTPLVATGNGLDVVVVNPYGCTILLNDPLTGG
ncbi:MAG: FG-GAP repeat domain-containing protein [Polyangia bacterium]